MKRLAGWLFRWSAFRIAVVVGLSATLLHWVFAARTGRIDGVPVLSRIENIFYDLKFHERNALGLGQKPSGQVVIGAVDEKAIDTLGRFPWSRADVARLVDKLTAAGARAVVFDMIFSDAAYEGRFAGARKLQARFDEVSLSGQGGEALVAQLEQARASATEALSGLDPASEEARALRGRLTPINASLEAVAAQVARLKEGHGAYAQALALESPERGPDEELARAVHESGRVVLGSFLLTQGEARKVSAEELTAASDLVMDMGISPPWELPELAADALLADPPLENTDRDLSVPLMSYAGAKSPLRLLVMPPEPQGDELPRPNASIGFFNTLPDDDAVIRREPLVMVVGEMKDAFGTLIVPSLDLAGLLKFYDAAPAETRLWTEGPGRLGEVALRPGSAGGVESPPQMSMLKRIPVDGRGLMLLNYYGREADFPARSLADVWKDDVEKIAAWAKGNIVIIGVTATGTYDQRVTPFDPMAAGVITHATAMENVIQGHYLQRPAWVLLAESLWLLVVGLLLGWGLTRVSVLKGIPLTLGAAAVWHAIDLGLFTRGFVVVSFLPMAEMLTIYVLQTVYRYGTEEAEKRQIRKAFQFYLNPSVIEEMLQDPSKLKLGGDKRVLSVMFSDIRGFTTISEKLTPEQLAKLINEYLTPMTNLVFQSGGTLDKYIGDALMAIWGAPVMQEDHALRACRTAVAMMRELEQLQARWVAEERGYPTIDIGIGINSGPMVVGNMGADQRFDYTVLGDNVNLASRLEGTNKDYRSHVMISQATLELCDGQVAARWLGAVRVKGKLEPVRIYELMDDKPAAGDLAWIIETFDAGVGLFQQQQWSEARARFRSILERWPEDGPSKAYVEFCDDYEASPPGEGWDGVYVMKHK